MYNRQQWTKPFANYTKQQWKMPDGQIKATETARAITQHYQKSSLKGDSSGTRAYKAGDYVGSTFEEEPLQREIGEMVSDMGDMSDIGATLGRHGRHLGDIWVRSGRFRDDMADMSDIANKNWRCRWRCARMPLHIASDIVDVDYMYCLLYHYESALVTNKVSTIRRQ